MTLDEFYLIISRLLYRYLVAKNRFTWHNSLYIYLDITVRIIIAQSCRSLWPIQIDQIFINCQIRTDKCSGALKCLTGEGCLQTLRFTKHRIPKNVDSKVVVGNTRVMIALNKLKASWWSSSCCVERISCWNFLSIGEMTETRRRNVPERQENVNKTYILARSLSLRYPQGPLLKISWIYISL